ncbi:hypothetical protein [Streptomyces sp. CBMA156]|uniref:hypothetical protein n=1 Tax=Streptomyces sp. CBMA156 TaxID=1930280 RepID=UPI001662036D|nr:hypothetical protein [Streptomyces sp. CBMA156]
MLDTLDLAAPFSLDGVCARLAAVRRRPIHLHPLPPGAAEAGACGLWLATGTDDYIFFEQQTSRPHQEHIVLHEIGHMLLDHPAPAALGAVVPIERLGQVDPALARHLLARTDYTTRQEQEAEMLASLIRTRAARAEEPAAERGPCGCTAAGTTAYSTVCTGC